MLTLNDGRAELWQWDTGRTLAVDADCSQVHFSNKVFGRSIDVDVTDSVAIIPDVLLQTDNDLNVWAFVGTAENGYTKISKTFKVNRRNKPADYVFTPPDQTTLSELVERLDKIEESQSPEAIKNVVDDYLAQNPVEIPVQSVNGQTGAVELTAEDVGAISQDALQEATNEALAQAKSSGEFDGPQGSEGPQGPKGDTGATGPKGDKGDKGEKGDKGDTGPAGEKGDKGDTGATGAAGSDGKSAYAYAVEGGYDGTEAEFAAKLAAEIPVMDATLTQSGQAADAKATGDAISKLSEEMLTEESDPTVPAWAKQPQKPTYTADEVGADESGTAEKKVSAHNTETTAHSDIRLLIQGLTERLNALADSDDTTLDQLSEVVAYIKSNRDMIESITTGKVSVSDIVDNLTTNVSNKPLSAAQGVALKALIDAISIPKTLPNPNALTIMIGDTTVSYDGSEAKTIEIADGSEVSY